MRNITLLIILGSSICFSAERNLSWKECVQITRENNITLKLAESNYKAQKELEDVAFSGFLPEINASMTTSKSYAEMSSAQEQNSVSGALTLSQNLFSGFLDKNKLKEAQARTLSSSLDWRISKLTVSSELKQAFVLLRYAYDQVLLTKKVVDRRKENLRIVELRYSSGLENKGSVLLSEAYYQQAQFEGVQAEENYRNYRKALYLVMGISEPEEDKVIPEVLAADKTLQAVTDFKNLVVNASEYQKNLASQEISRLTVEKYRASFYPTLNFREYRKIRRSVSFEL